ncbi:MAG: hypothetical protein U0271_44400 [Polyangiaceae bacterium]
MAMAAALFYQGRWVAHAGGAACALFAFSAVVRARLTRPKVGPVEIGADFVRARGITLPRATLSALVLPRPHGLFDLELRAPGKPRLLLRCRSLPEATHWMTALGLDPRARTASIAGYTLRPGFVWAARRPCFPRHRDRSPRAEPRRVGRARDGSGGARDVRFTEVMRRGSITVGADGVVTRDLLGARFIRWADVSALHLAPRPQRPSDEDQGRTIELSASKTVLNGLRGRHERAGRLGIRLSDAFSANVRAREEKPRLAHLIARSGREVGAWASSLAELSRAPRFASSRCSPKISSTSSRIRARSPMSASAPRSP